MDDDEFDYVGLPDEDDSFLQDIEQFIKVERLDTQQTALPAVNNASDQLNTISQAQPGSSSGAVFEGKEELMGSSPGLTQDHVRQPGPSHAGQTSSAGLSNAQPSDPYGSLTHALPGLTLLNIARSSDSGLLGHDPAPKRPAAALEVQTQIQPLQQRLQPLSPMAQPPAPMGPVPSIGTWRPSHLVTEGSRNNLLGSGIQERVVLGEHHSGGGGMGYGRESEGGGGERGCEDGSGMLTPRSSTTDAAASDRWVN